MIPPRIHSPPDIDSETKTEISNLVRMTRFCNQIYVVLLRQYIDTMQDYL